MEDHRAGNVVLRCAQRLGRLHARRGRRCRLRASPATNEFFSNELLNLLDRAGQHFRVLRKESLTAADLRGLRAVIYADAEPPSPALRKELTGVRRGRRPADHDTGVGRCADEDRDEHPRYYGWAAGKGRIARSIAPPDDPYQMANDAVIAGEPPHDLVRFWNAGAAGSYYAVSPDRKQAVVHLLFYANRGPDIASVRVAGPYRKVKASHGGHPGDRRASAPRRRRMGSKSTCHRCRSTWHWS